MYQDSNTKSLTIYSGKNSKIYRRCFLALCELYMESAADTLSLTFRLRINQNYYSTDFSYSLKPYIYLITLTLGLKCRILNIFFG